MTRLLAVGAGALLALHLALALVATPAPWAAAGWAPLVLAAVAVAALVRAIRVAPPGVGRASLFLRARLLLVAAAIVLSYLALPRWGLVADYLHDASRAGALAAVGLTVAALVVLLFLLGAPGDEDVPLLRRARP